MVRMPACSVRGYLQFLATRRSDYLRFNKELFLGELAGFGAGIAVSEAAAGAGLGPIEISAYSSAADYAGSVGGFFAVYYKDQRPQYLEMTRKVRFKKILGNALRLWPSVVAADVAFIIVRPYIHHLLLSMEMEAGIAATIAHFLAFGVFNLVAVISRSLVDYQRYAKLNTA